MGVTKSKLGYRPLVCVLDQVYKKKLMQIGTLSLGHKNPYIILKSHWMRIPVPVILGLKANMNSDIQLETACIFFSIKPLSKTRLGECHGCFHLYGLPRAARSVKRYYKMKNSCLQLDTNSQYLDCEAIAIRPWDLIYYWQVQSFTCAIHSYTMYYNTQSVCHVFSIVVITWVSLCLTNTIK